MECKPCIVCKLIDALVIVGALNWGLMGFFNMDLVAKLLVTASVASRAVYGLVGVAGIMTILKCFKMCPCQKPTKA